MEAGPTYTASGRQIRQPRRGEYGEIQHSHGNEGPDELSLDYKGGHAADEDDDSDPVRSSGRATRSAGRHVPGASNPRKRKHIDGYNEIDSMSDEEDAAPSGDEWDSDQNAADDHDMPDADDESEESSEEDESEDEQPRRSLILKLKVKVPTEMLTSSNMNGVSESKPEPTVDKPDTKQAEHEEKPPPSQAIAGAPKGEAAPAAAAAPDSSSNGLPNGYTTVQKQQPQPPPANKQPAEHSSPPSSSTYPTPVSASFPTQDLKPTAAPAVQAPQANGEAVQTNGAGAAVATTSG
jgi:hypothetical protein